MIGRVLVGERSRVTRALASCGSENLIASYSTAVSPTRHPGWSLRTSFITLGHLALNGRGAIEVAVDPLDRLHVKAVSAPALASPNVVENRAGPDDSDNVHLHADPDLHDWRDDSKSAVLPSLGRKLKLLFGSVTPLFFSHPSIAPQDCSNSALAWPASA